MGACLILLLLTATVAAVAAPDFAGKSSSAWRDEFQKKWSAVKPEAVSKSADSGDAEAQYFTALTARRKATESREHSSLLRWQLSQNGQNFSQAEIQAAAGKWGAAAEADLRAAALKGDRGALWTLSRFEDKRALEFDGQALEWIMRAAAGGLVPAQYDMALRSSQDDLIKGVRQAAAQGWEAATHKFADLHITGEILPPDLAKIVEYLQQAADLGCARAQYQLARQYANGNGQPRTEQESVVALLEKSAASGYAPAIQALADRYRTGRGAPVDYVRAIRDYQLARQALNQTSGSAQPGSPINLPHHILDLVAPNLEPISPLSEEFVGFAFVLGIYRKATERGDPNAMMKLGQLYVEGKVVPRSNLEAYCWFDLAANRGLTSATPPRDKLKASLSEDDQPRVRQWLNEFGRPPKIPPQPRPSL